MTFSTFQARLSSRGSYGGPGRAGRGVCRGDLQVLVPPEAEDQAPVPAGAYNVAAQLLAAEAGVDDNPPVAPACT